MNQNALLLFMAEKLERAGISYFIAGSHGSNWYGEPRTTVDIDIVIDPTPEQLDAFLASFDDSFYVSPPTAREALQRRSMFNIIDIGSGWKVDLIIRKPNRFNTEEFSRRRAVEMEGRRVVMISPEDAILSKLHWAKKGESERQLRDVESIVVVQWGQLDLEYLHHWAAELKVAIELEQVFERAALLQDDAPDVTFDTEGMADDDRPEE
jgi:hypothetical protein